MSKSLSTLRIIGGKWRSRRISFLPVKGLRPTADATREILFNWLAADVRSASCLDLFAGSGALSFEALSRGAKHVVMVDAAVKVICVLKKNAQNLAIASTDIEFCRANVPKHLKKIKPQIFNLVFLDPPFYKNLIKPTCEKLVNLGYLNADTLIYIEAEKDLSIEENIPSSWQILRNKVTGQVGFYLIKTSTPGG